MDKVLIIHGPNLNLLGQREVSVYGTETMETINSSIKAKAASLKLDVEFMQSNHEGEIVDRIGRSSSEGFKAIVINPAAYTHTSVAIRDAVSATGLPVIEVHLSNIYSREEFRHNSLIAPVARGQISGFGRTGYLLAIEAAAEIIKKNEA